MKTNETWKPVIGYEATYEVSNHGRVRRSAPGKATKPGRILKPYVRQNRRVTVSLTRTGLGTQRDIAGLVAEAFHGPRPSGKEINHIDGNPANNTPENLEYCTRRENMQHAYRLGLVRLGIGEDQHFAKLNTDQIIVIRNCSAPVAVLARVFGVAPITIRHAQKRRTWKHVS